MGQVVRQVDHQMDHLPRECQMHKAAVELAKHPDKQVMRNKLHSKKDKSNNPEWT